MTQLRHCKCAMSNYFDRLLRGIGHRGSSFSDIDAVSHDGKTNRFLLQEFKEEGEDFNQAQHWMLKDISAIPEFFTVWHVVKRRDGMIGFALYGSGKPMEIITVQEYQRRFEAWWANKPDEPPATPLVRASPKVQPLVHPPVERELMDSDISW